MKNIDKDISISTKTSFCPLHVEQIAGSQLRIFYTGLVLIFLTI